MASLRAKAARSPMADRVEFHGHVSDRAALRGFYATAIASVSPGFVGLSLTQSLGFGVPMIIARDEPHAPEFKLPVKGGMQSSTLHPSESLARALVAAEGKRRDWYSRREEISRDCRDRYSAEAMASGFLCAVEAVGRRIGAGRPATGVLPAALSTSRAHHAIRPSRWRPSVFRAGNATECSRLLTGSLFSCLNWGLKHDEA